MPDVSEPAGEGAAQRRARALLAVGAALGLALAGVGIMRRGPALEDALPEGAVASVNGSAVRLEEYQRAVQALASDRRDPIGEQDKRHVLDRLVDEELLVQRAIELGLTRSDRRVRGDLVSALIQAVVSESEADEPDQAEIESFYAENRDYFARSGRLALREILVRGQPVREEAEARARADEAAARLRGGEPFEAVDAALGDRQIAPLPSDPLPPAKLVEYLGPSAARAAEALAPGEVGDPVRGSAGFHVLLLLAREPGSVPPLEGIREEVRVELRRRAGDRALRAYLDLLRGRADVRLAAALP
jgi:parvulin-like peptidyl-prolyl isomerase